MIKKYVAIVTLSLFASNAAATVIAGNNSYTSTTSGSDFSLGQSVTTSSGVAWDNISFNLIDSTGMSYANGTLYLLDQEYLGNLQDLSNSAIGFVATSISSAGDVWTFDSSLTLNASTTYWFYMDTLFDGSRQILYSEINPYSGGAAYQADSTTGDFSAHFNKTDYFYDLAFSLQGRVKPQPVPEPASVALLSLGLLGLVASRRRKV